MMMSNTLLRKMMMNQLASDSQIKRKSMMKPFKMMIKTSVKSTSQWIPSKMRFHQKEKSISKRIRIVRRSMKKLLLMNWKKAQMKISKMRKWSPITTYQRSMKVVFHRKGYRAMLMNQTTS